MSVVTLSDKRWPLVTMLWPQIYDASHIESGIQQVEDLLQRGQSFALIADLRQAAPTTAEQSVRIAAFLQSKREDLTRLCKGNALVVSTLDARAALTGLAEKLGMTVPFRAVANIDDAEGWCWNQLEAARDEERSRRSSG